MKKIVIILVTSILLTVNCSSPNNKEVEPKGEIAQIKQELHALTLENELKEVLCRNQVDSLNKIIKQQEVEISKLKLKSK